MRAPSEIHIKSFEARGLVELKRTFEVITPVFGGGSQAGVIDAQNPIRSASIRGQLRFWWRATQAGRFDSIQSMRAEEARLWGAASIPGLIAISVEGQRPAVSSVNAAGFQYGAFPLLQENPPKPLSRLNGEARLKLVGPIEAEKQMDEAMVAWLLFGGLGGRTRRGFGAVSSPDLPRPEVFLHGLHGGGLPGVSVIGPRTRMKMRAPQATADRALTDGLECLKRFRQGPGVGRNPGQHNHPGRSRWPEPDEIRRLTHIHAHQHAPAHPVQKFPRAAFGMPIIFHFVGGGEPFDQSLQPVGKERRASPLILRPYHSQGGYSCLALVLEDSARLKEHIELRGGPQVQYQLTDQEAQQITPIKGQADVLGAFLNFFAG
ncbi:type III-B CRISPR module RAMP protein Cmr1 [Myxococcota bacterium]|nr:type III-B CRISPR module RAMP protein Cmr1 [Myxococcota bacterium]